MGFVLHIQPDSIKYKDKSFLGSTKDVACRAEYFATRDIEVQTYHCTGRSDKEALIMLMDNDLSYCDAVLFEYETYLKCLAYLKDKYPSIRRVVRCHNANLPHWLDYYRGRIRMLDDGVSSNYQEAISDFRRALDRFRIDCECAELADHMLSICDWETDWYWSRLVDRSKVKTVPYFLPRYYADQVPKGIKKRNLYVCYMGTGGLMQPFLYDAGQNTIDLVAKLPVEVAKDWEFYITGILKPPNILGPLGRIVSTGRLPSPLPMLQEARVVSILSDLGLGFKTKILEAIECGCWVLMTKVLYDRIPYSVRPWCIGIDMADPAAFSDALSKCLESPPAGSPNETLREQAYSNLDVIFGISMRKTQRSVGAITGLPPKNDEEVKGAASKIFPYPTSTFRGGEDFWRLRIAPILDRYGVLSSESRIFEHGVGMGRVLYAASAGGYVCGGTDSSASVLENCRQFLPNATRLGIIAPDGVCDFPSGWADFAYCCDSIKDMPSLSRVSRALAEISRILKSGGYFTFCFRSTSRQRTNLPWWKREILLHREDKTIYFKLDSLKNHNRNLPRLPYLKIGVHRHSSLTGIPFSHYAIRTLLSNASLEIVEIHLDKSGDGQAYWVTCRKLG
jgi:SAM-dependent methyltransferase